MPKGVNNLRGTKNIYASFADDQGHITKEPKGLVSYERLPKEVVGFLYEYLDFALHSKILNEASIVYIKSPYTSSVEYIFNKHNENHPDNIFNLKTAASNLDYNRRKLDKVFDSDMLDVLTSRFKGGLEKLPHYREQLDNAIKQYSRGDAFGNSLFIEISRHQSRDIPTKDAIEEFMMAIDKYRTVNKKTIQSIINEQYKDVIGYFNYLSQCKDRNEWQEEIWQELQAFLNGGVQKIKEEN